MKKALACILIVPLILISLAGCLAPVILGGAVGALGGYAISKDTIESETDIPYWNLWNSAVEVAKLRGAISQEDSQKGCLKMKVEANDVWIRLVRLTRATTRVRVKARRYYLPNLSLAEDIFVKIMEGAK